MKRLLLLNCLLLASLFAFSKTIIVKNNEELKKANKEAQPGDIIILQNGEWKNVTISLNCNGTKEKPITFKAQTAGKVVVTGYSQLRLGGNYIVVDGLYFLNGYAGDEPVISYRINSNQLANNSRVTNCVVNDFNNPKRMDENNWVAFYGKNNRLDHCSFLNKKNMGVLLAVILDDERSRENFHSIDHNHFGFRLPLASNGGEIIRVGVSQHCQFNSNTQIVDNFFERCDGETEIVSIKSGSNVVRGNLFKECQGGVVLRHGDNNTVENNIFRGNGKEGTGGVRVINKGQWVVNNLFYNCRGVDFRSPLSIMNGIPNSPAHRYVQVSDAVIANNTFFNCAPVSFCEGSDTERTLPPANVALSNNIFYNIHDQIIYRAFDNISGFSFSGNEISTEIKQEVANGFMRTSFTTQKNENKPFVVSVSSATKIPDSLQRIARQRLRHELSSKKGFTDLALLKKIEADAYNKCGATWFMKSNSVSPPKLISQVNCKNAEEIYKQLDRKEPVYIALTGKKYVLDRPFAISKKVGFINNSKNQIEFVTTAIQTVFSIQGNGNLTLDGLDIDGTGVMATHFISNDTSRSSNHYNLSVRNSSFKNLRRENGCHNFFYAHKYMIADSIVISNCSFSNNNTNGVIMNEEKDNKGYYSAERILVSGNLFSNQNGALFDIYRGGNDESTMGPLLVFRENKLDQCNNEGNPLFTLFGVQKSFIEKNNFTGSNSKSTLILFKDLVRAAHSFKENIIQSSGEVVSNKFVVAEGNIF